MFLVAPFLWFVGVVGLFGGMLSGYNLIGLGPGSPASDPAIIVLAWVAGLAGLGLLIYGLVAKSNTCQVSLTRILASPYPASVHERRYKPGNASNHANPGQLSLEHIDDCSPGQAEGNGSDESEP